MMQAQNHVQEPSLFVYRIIRKISLGDQFYIFDIDCNREGSRLCFSAVNSEHKSFSREPVFFMSPSGRYIALEEVVGEVKINYMYGTKSSVVKQHSYIVNTSLTGDFSKEDNIFRHSGQTCQKRHLRSILEDRAEIWHEDVSQQTTGILPVIAFTPQGIALSKNGGILTCFWNNEIGERSLGKVVKLDKDFEIFTDKNRPLYVCPTYIAENGNGDICVSDVRAVVVTDAGGMLRFRYQGNYRESNFDPYGICCNSSCNIIVADMKNDKIHMVDKDGKFLHYVTYGGIKMPRALCIDKKDHLYVGEWNSDEIKVITR